MALGSLAESIMALDHWLSRSWHSITRSWHWLSCSWQVPLMTQILQRIQDTNKKVQAAACSAFAQLEEEAQGELIPYLPHIIPALMHAFGRYQAKNMILLLDALSALADSVHAGLSQIDLVRQIFPPILAKWEQFEDLDTSMFALIECLTSLCQAVGGSIQEWAQVMFARCVRIIHTTLVNVKNPLVDKELIVSSIDLLSSVIEGLSERADLAAELITNSQLMTLVMEVIKLEHPESCQSAFAMIGDMSKTCLQQLGPCLPTLLPLMQSSLNPQLLIGAMDDRCGHHGNGAPPIVSVSNNACWAIGEMAKRAGAELKQYYPPVIISITQLIGYQRMHPGLLLNMTICLGRISLNCADTVAPHLDKVAMVWCFRTCRMRNDVEKEDSCVGLCNAIALNASAIVPSFVPFLIVVNSWHGRAPAALKATFTQLLDAFTANLGMSISQWLSNPNVLDNLAIPDRRLAGVDVIENNICWDAHWQKRRWCPIIMAKELAEQGYKV
eukprot:TRINITY_DN14715_c0_g1_i1.p1 TRINITY_DN14715_c0_g1~~TRINITY_DN14715_c0_g1_i1.p1  ORF type:complete len:499 (+),score=119.41 TRINITY_DN14715_c0_g1_i1:1007-2503(+)